MVRVTSENGQGLVEYGMIIILVAIVVVLLLTVFGDSVADLFQTVVSSI